MATNDDCPGKVLVSVDNDTPGCFDATVKKLQQRGLHVLAKMPIIGTVRGSIDASKKASLAKVDGVIRVDDEGVMHTTRKR